MKLNKNTLCSSALCLSMSITGALSCNLVAASQSADQVDPEAASGMIQKELVRSNKYMVAAANPIATQAGYDVLIKK